MWSSYLPIKRRFEVRVDMEAAVSNRGSTEERLRSEFWLPDGSCLASPLRDAKRDPVVRIADIKAVIGRAQRPRTCTRPETKTRVSNRGRAPPSCLPPNNSRKERVVHPATGSHGVARRVMCAVPTAPSGSQRGGGDVYSTPILLSREKSHENQSALTSVRRFVNCIRSWRSFSYRSPMGWWVRRSGFRGSTLAYPVRSLRRC